MVGNYLIDELFEAIEEKQNVNKIQQIIESGCDVNGQVEDGCTPLIAAVIIGNLKIVKLLVKLGANVDLQDGYNDSPLFYAVFNNFQEIADYLEPLTSQKNREIVDRFKKTGKLYPRKQNLGYDSFKNKNNLDLPDKNQSMTYHRTIHFSDTDTAGVVYFAALLSICHEAYENALQMAGINLKTFFTSSDIAIPIVHADIDFYQPLFCGDRIEINLKTTQLNDTEFEINYQVFNENDLDKLIAKATTKHVSINPKIRKRNPLPLSIVQWLQSDKNNQ